MKLRLIVGLGNEGAEYTKTRHNAGFWFIDQLAEKLGGAWQAESKFHGRIVRLENFLLLAPATWMNRSGQSVSAVAKFYKIEPDQILVAHDDLDLLPGEIRFKQGGGGGGHNGVKDIIAQLGSPDFWRLRFGIGHPRTLNVAQAVADFVLHPPRREEQTALDQAIRRTLDAWPVLVNGETAAIQRLFHVKA